MSLRRRILFVTITGLVLVLFFYSFLIYVFFVRISIEGETRLLWNRAQTVLRKPEVRQEKLWAPGLLDEFLMEHSMLRIIAPTGEVRIVSENDPRLSQEKPVYRDDYHTRILSRGMYKLIYIQVPILALPSKQQTGLLEIGKCLDLTKGYLYFLILTLSAGSLFAAACSVIIALLFVRWIYKPITQLSDTMERIESSGSYRRLEGELVTDQDEFGRLGLTFNRMIAKLEKNYDRQRHFIEEVSHELRTPLTVIKSYAGMLKRWGASESGLRDEAVAAISEEADRLQQLVQELLKTAGRGEFGSSTEMKPFDLLKLMHQTAKELSRSFKRRIAVQPDARSGYIVEGDPVRIKQLLIILLDNAIAYSDRSVSLFLEEQEERVVITVRDRGMGIAQEHLRHLFVRFYRGDQAKYRRTGGSGLGLSIAKKIVDEHQGTITIASELSRGTVVTISLPKQQESRPPEETEEPH